MKMKAQEHLERYLTIFVPRLKTIGVDPETPVFADYLCKLPVRLKNGTNRRLLIYAKGNGSGFKLITDGFTPGELVALEAQFAAAHKEATVRARGSASQGIGVNGGVVKSSGEKKRPTGDNHLFSEGTSSVRIYVDGSFIVDQLGWGFVAVNGAEKLDEEWGTLRNDDNLHDMHQIGGELHALYEACLWCKDRGITEVTIVFDYLGLAKWMTGEWQAKNPAVREYLARVSQVVAEGGLSITWEKANAHTGDYWNEYADKLAKKGSGKY